MHRLGIVFLLLGAFACDKGGKTRSRAADLDTFLVTRAQQLLPALNKMSGGGGGGGSDGDYNSQFDRRLETQEPIPAEKHADLLSKLAADTRAWLTEHGLVIRARGTTGDEEGQLDRFAYRYDGDRVVGWVVGDYVRNEAGGLTVLLTVTEHVE